MDPTRWPQLLPSRVEFRFRYFRSAGDFWRGAVLAGVVEDENIHDPRRGFAGGYHLELAMLDLPTLPLIGLPYGWGRDYASIIRQLPQHGRHARQWRGPAARRQPYYPVDDAQGRLWLAGGAYPLRSARERLAMRAHATGQGRKIYESVGAKRDGGEFHTARHAPDGHRAHEPRPGAGRHPTLTGAPHECRTSSCRMAACRPRPAPRIPRSPSLPWRCARRIYRARGGRGTAVVRNDFTYRVGSGL